MIEGKKQIQKGESQHLTVQKAWEINKTCWCLNTRLDRYTKAVCVSHFQSASYLYRFSVPLSLSQTLTHIHTHTHTHTHMHSEVMKARVWYGWCKFAETEREGQRDVGRTRANITEGTGEKSLFRSLFL